MIGRGVYPASVTPFTEKGEVDAAGIPRLLSWFQSQRCAGIVLAGTNGEGPSLGAVEKRDLFRVAARLADGWPVIAGIATSSLDEAIWLSRQAHRDGCAAALVMPPGYFREASAVGIEAWFEALAAASPCPLLLYNFPKRTGIVLTSETVARLSRLDTIIGIKDSSGDKANITGYAQAMPGRSLFVGDETLLLDALSHGWTGSISGAANVIPRWLAAAVEEWPDAAEGAAVKFELILPLLQRLRSCPQPAANKVLLHRLRVLDRADVRLPLTAIDLPPGLAEEVLSLQGGGTAQSFRPAN